MQTQQRDRPRHFEGLDGMRLLAALAVIFSHAFLIATGTEESEPFVRLLGPGNIAGLYGVFTFFIISGFLLARSLSSRRSAVAYAVNRTLRILPGYVVCVLVVALAIGPTFTALSPGRYFSSSDVIRFVGTTLNTLGDSALPGVYAYHGPLSTVVNGSLWSLRYEALSYVLLLFLWTLFRTSGRVAVTITVMALLTRISPLFESAMVGVAYTLPYFAAGVSMYWVHCRYGTNRAGAIASVALFAASAAFGMQQYAFPVCGAYAIVFTADRPNLGSTIASKVGDCSYGLYLYGWPAEQMVKQLTSTNNPWLLFIMSVPLAFAFALISCHLVERPAMRASGFCIARLRSALGRVFAPRRPAVVGAKVAFVVGVALLLSSRTLWWYFLESMSELLLTVCAGGFIAMLLARATRSAGARPVAVGPGEKGGRYQLPDKIVAAGDRL